MNVTNIIQTNLQLSDKITYNNCINNEILIKIKGLIKYQ